MLASVQIELVIKTIIIVDAQGTTMDWLRSALLCFHFDSKNWRHDAHTHIVGH